MKDTGLNISVVYERDWVPIAHAMCATSDEEVVSKMRASGVRVLRLSHDACAV